MSDTQSPIPVISAFLVVQTHPGEWEAIPDINHPVQPERAVTVPEMRWACTEVASDIECSKVAAMVGHQMMQLTTMVQQQAATKALRDKLKI